MPGPLEDYLVMLSELHKGGDMRKLKDKDDGAYVRRARTSHLADLPSNPNPNPAPRPPRRKWP